MSTVFFHDIPATISTPMPIEKIQDPHDVITFFNYSFCIASEAGKTVVLRARVDHLLRRQVFDRMEIRDLRQFYSNRLVKTGEKRNGDPILTPIVDVWLLSPHRRTYASVIFDPSEAAGPDHLNLWRGFTVTPKPGSWQLLRDHVFWNICNGEQAKFDFLMGYCARMAQFPGEPAEVAIVLQSEEEGSGKGIFIRALMRLFGQHALAISNAKHLTGNFNSHLQDCVLLFADEAFYAGNPAHVGILKSLITEPTLTIEPKYGRVVLCRNHLHIFMATNEKWAVPAGLHARRFCVLKVSASRKNDHDYFAAIMAELEAGGYEAMLHELLHYDLTNFNIRDVPFTIELSEQKKHSLDIPMQWWLDVLQRGYVFRSKLGLEETFHVWTEDIATELLFASYTEFSKGRREHHPLSRETFGRFMRQIGARPRRLQNAIIGERLAASYSNSREPQAFRAPRAHGFHLGDLSSARAAFERATGISFSWPDDGQDDAGAEWN
jgi:hypothetical protein